MKDQKLVFSSLGNTNYPHFNYETYGVKGFGKLRHPIISMDQYIDHSQDTELHVECCKGLALTNDYKMGMVYGDLPPEEEAKHNNHTSWTNTLNNLKKIDPTGIHHEALIEVAERAGPGKEMQAMYKYAYFALGSVIPWFFACYLKQGGFSDKNKNNEKWTPAAAYFPKLLKYIETLPFKEIGRIMFFTTYPKSGVAMHRDSIVTEHKDHNINLFFDGGWRPSFIWDEKTKVKHYLTAGARSYFFNNRDYHGVDPEPVFRYTLRIDGTFTDELCEKLNLEDGYTWKWSYEE